MPNWTRQQRDAIEDRGHSLIVCAAAGSGKTAVLVERIVRLVCEGCPVDRMLVVTFTNAAAGEMRLRIGAALGEEARKQPELGEQMMALSRASISTLHRFCGNLLREQFQALGIDPSFRIGDEQECGVLFEQAMEDALYACYEVGSEAFMAADECYTQEELADFARQIRRFMMTRPDPWAWLDQAVKACAQDAHTLGESEAVRLLMGQAQETLDHLLTQCGEILLLCRGEGGPQHYAPACEADMTLVRSLGAAAQQGMEPLRQALCGLSFATLGRKPKGAAFDEELAQRVKDEREALKKVLRELARRFSLTMEEAAADIAMTKRPLEGLRELVRTADTLYTALKRQRGLMDFDDLEHGALTALQDEQVRKALAERYRYIFVDEYQDSSAIQEAIVSSFAREDGLFLVGDVKQSIYRFRQAEPALFQAKAAWYDRPEQTAARRIDLQCNFRSRANVLEGVNAVFERIMRGDVTEIEYDERERLIPGLPVREDDPPVELHVIYRTEAEDEDEAAQSEETEDEEQEMAAVEREALIAARRIHELVGTPFYDAKSASERPLAYRDMAVLMRVARGCASLAADILKSQGIPVFCDAGEGYFDIPEIREMMALLQAIANGAQDEALIAALHGPALGLTEEELARIRVHTPESRTPYCEAVRRYREEMDDSLAGKLAEFEQKMTRWRLCARHQGVDRLIERIYAETGFLAQAGALPGGAARQANLHLLTSRARAFMRAQGGSLSAFLRYAKRLRAGGDSMSASVIGEGEDVVRIMTTHKSKGLEFPVVFVLGMGRRMSAGSRSTRLLMHAQLGIGLPCVDTALQSERDTLLRCAIRERTAQEQLAEEVRILYVAMTRARERLILIGDAGGERVPDSWKRDAPVRLMRTGLDMVCPTLTAAGAGLNLPQERIVAGKSHWQVFAHHGDESAACRRRTDEAVQRLLAQLEQTPLYDERLAHLMHAKLKGTAAVRKTSVSAVLRDEKRAAQEEDERITEIQRLPRFMQEEKITGAQIGTVFHRIMCMLALEPLRATHNLENEIERQTALMLEEGVIAQKEADVLPARLARDFFAAPVGIRMLASERVEREWAFTYRREAEGKAQLVQGVIDCCFMERGGWVLVDYKTDAPVDIQAVIARYKPQLDLYADALERITGLPVRERVLYLVRQGVGYNV